MVSKGDHDSADYRMFQSTRRHLAHVMADLQELAVEAPWKMHSNNKLYFDNAQHDRIEGLFFRFLVCRHVLVELAQRTEDSATESTTSSTTTSISTSKKTVIAFAAGICSALYDAKLVLAFQSDKTAVSKLNENFYRHRIPEGTFRAITLTATDETKLQALSHAFLLYTQHCHDSHNEDVGTSNVSTDEAETPPIMDPLLPAGYNQLFQDIYQQAAEVDALIAELIQGEKKTASSKSAIALLPSLSNKIRHSKAAELTRLSADKENHFLIASRALLFKNVSRLKSPTAHLIKFSDEQKAHVEDMLKPGDLILTYTAGYMSDVFIPGAFKHAITYVGSVQDRKDAGLLPENIPDCLTIPDDAKPLAADDTCTILDDITKAIGDDRDKLLRSFEVSHITKSDPTPADVATVDAPQPQDAANVIEAVAEGVIFNNLAHLMDTHINRMLVLRPNLSYAERIQALTAIFRFLGAPYDFGFDFTIASQVVCTEVIYRAFNGKGQFDFQLVQRAGHPTLSADDIVDTYLSDKTSFDFVLLAEEDPKCSHYEAGILEGENGEARLSELMADQKKTLADPVAQQVHNKKAETSS